MNILSRILICTSLLACLTACEKTYNNTYYYGNEKETGNNGSTNSKEDNGKSDTGSGDNSSNSDNEGEGSQVEGILTVEQTLNQSLGSDVTLEGYIVGTSKTSLKSAVFMPPFDYDTSLFLSDTPCTDGTIDESHVIQIALTSPTPTSYRSELNLKDNPELWNKKFQISGFVKTYYNRTAIKGIYSYQELE